MTDSEFDILKSKAMEKIKISIDRNPKLILDRLRNDGIIFYYSN